MLGIAGIIILFSIIGMIATCSTIPNQNDKIIALKQQVKSLDAKINEYKVAMKFENLFMLGASPKNVMNFEALEAYLIERKNFYKKVNNENYTMPILW